MTRVTTRRRHLLPALAALAGCAGDPRAEAPPDDACPGEVRTALVTGLSFARPQDGVSSGFDLDGEDGGDVGCDRPDLTGPDGAEGIDNALGTLLPILDQTEAAGLQGIAQDNIDNGNLLLMARITDPERADCATFQVVRARGPALTGTDGRLLAGQTLALDPDLPQTEVYPAVPVDDGVLVRDISLRVPLTIFDAELDLNIDHGQMALHPTEDGGWRGVWGGGIAWAQIVEQLADTGVDAALKASLPGLLGAVADLAPGDDGVCQEISLAFDIEAANAWLLESDAP